VSGHERSAGNAWPFRLNHEQFGALRFQDFRGGDIRDVARCLYRDQPEFMQALEADVRERGVQEPVELGHEDTRTRSRKAITGSRRLTWRAGMSRWPCTESVTPATRRRHGGTSCAAITRENTRPA
jgi:hypothetical protein